jgi:DNA-binding response OmpR family regulator
MPTTPEASAAPKKLLVVDDNEVIVKTIAVKLKSAGFQVFTATDGSEAVAQVRKEKPDLILLDLGFPPDLGRFPHHGMAAAGG